MERGVKWNMNEYGGIWQSMEEPPICHFIVPFHSHHRNRYDINIAAEANVRLYFQTLLLTLKYDQNCRIKSCRLFSIHRCSSSQPDIRIYIFFFLLHFLLNLFNPSLRSNCQRDSRSYLVQGWRPSFRVQSRCLKFLFDEKLNFILNELFCSAVQGITQCLKSSRQANSCPSELMFIQQFRQLHHFIVVQ